MEARNAGCVLVIEDGDEDFDLLRLAFERCGSTHELERSVDGDSALERLREAAQRPLLVLLDLNMPGMDGREVLKELRREEALRAVPVIVLSTSNNPRDVELCYREGANCYAVKPIGLEKLERLVALIKDFWLDTVELPIPRSGPLR